MLFSDCGGFLYARSGFIRSLYYPGSYSNDAVCVWVISVPIGNIISISVIDLNIEDGCYNAYIDIRDGDSISAPQIARLCGSRKPREALTSTSNFLYVSFVSYSYGTGRGFELYYTSG